ncbi:DUF6266 family protein [Daejeonella sp. JGW-45]|uniref:DUF6266 family protein n=1 Tax=Daejeonella sp. JGW-45 TaxID=3034148 RepID=UPI0023EB7296|nr:DUF6266 family protein [Daejeonella sp. JGW-45]
MAHLHSGIMGPVSGKIGNLVYYTYRGKCYVRQAPKKTKKRPTLKQKIQRVKFGIAARFVSPVAKLVNYSYKQFNRRKTGVNVLIRDILNDALIGKYPNFGIDYSRVELLRGSLPWSKGVLFHTEGSRDLDISWELWADGAHLEDELIVMTYWCNARKWLFAEGVAQRLQGSCTLHIEAPIDEGPVQVWMAFRSPDRRTFSNSEFLGEVIMHKSPSYEN